SIKLLILAAALVVAVTIYLVVSTGPTYQGKPLRYWTQRLEHSDAETRSHAAAAIQAMGESAVRPLIIILQKKDSPLDEPMTDLARHVPFPLGWRPARWDRGDAAAALGALGPVAREAVPALIEACRETNSSVGVVAEAALIRIRQ